jgi:hypothetical protein
MVHRKRSAFSLAVFTSPCGDWWVVQAMVHRPCLRSVLETESGCLEAAPVTSIAARRMSTLSIRGTSPNESQQIIDSYRSRSREDCAQELSPLLGSIMDSFYLRNIPKYHSLLDKLDPVPKPRICNGVPSPNMTVAARIRPLSEHEAFPSAIFPRSSQKNVVDIHDLYNHPKGIPVLRVRLKYLLDTHIQAPSC